MSIYTIPLETDVVGLDAAIAFANLTPTEKSYAYHLGRADWEGAKICLLQCSPESVPIFALLQLVFAAQPVRELVAAAEAKGLSADEVSKALMYAAAFYGNLGNYKSFGDTKFVPDLLPERFKLFLASGAADATKVDMLWDECNVRMYSLRARQRQLGLGADKGISTYFSANCDESDADIAGKFMESIGLSAYNTRLFKASDGAYTVRLASSVVACGDDAMTKVLKDYTFAGKSFKVCRGDYAPLMARVVAAVGGALPHVASDVQKAMLERYVDSFALGSIDDHKGASREWIKDIGPAVESYIGFIESYRDPSGMRGEWEGFVSCVNREVSRKFQLLVDMAEKLLLLLPWPAVFEKDVFMRPDFTSLDVLAFGSSGVPAGINIPNYDDIRQTEGFKNVSLGNVLQASYGAGVKPVTFVVESDQALFKKLKGEAFEVQVGCHELLGHGSGRLYHNGTEDAAKLVASKVEHPITGLPITGPFYAAGATWDSLFGKIASSYEECRAECVGIYLSLDTEVLEVFGYEGATAVAAAAEGGVHDVTYINWLLMVRAGLTALEFYTPETKAWRQAHMNARYVILRVLLEAGGGLVELRRTVGADGEADVEAFLDRGKILRVGKPAVAAFLKKLQVYKSLGDLAGGSGMFGAYSDVVEEMLDLRGVVMARKEPRKLLVQPHMHEADGGVALRQFDQTPTGMIESFVARFPAEDKDLLNLYYADKADITD